MQFPGRRRPDSREASESILRSAGSSSSVKFTLSVPFHGVDSKMVICVVYEGASSLHCMPAGRASLDQMCSTRNTKGSLRQVTKIQ